MKILLFCNECSSEMEAKDISVNCLDDISIRIKPCACKERLCEECEDSQSLKKIKQDLKECKVMINNIGKE